MTEVVVSSVELDEGAADVDTGIETTVVEVDEEELEEVLSTAELVELVLELVVDVLAAVDEVVVEVCKCSGSTLEEDVVVEDTETAGVYWLAETVGRSSLVVLEAVETGLDEVSELVESVEVDSMLLVGTGEARVSVEVDKLVVVDEAVLSVVLDAEVVNSVVLIVKNSAVELEVLENSAAVDVVWIRLDSVELLAVVLSVVGEATEEVELSIVLSEDVVLEAEELSVSEAVVVLEVITLEAMVEA